MNSFKRLTLVLVACTTFNACAQKSNNNLLREKNMAFIETLADSLYSRVQEYPQEQQINYEVSINTKNSYDVLVNDLLISYRYSHITGEITSFINCAILKSGKQKLQVKLYPRYINKGEQLQTLINDDFLDITISSFTWRKDNNGVENEKEVLKYTLPKKDKNGNTIDYTQKSELIIDLEFDAQVPYELKGWTDGVVFDLKDSVQLKNKLSLIYQQIIEDYKNKRFEKVKRESILSDSEFIQYYYYPKDKFINNFSDYSYDEDMDLFPLENYDIFFYSNQKIVSLRRIDTKYRGHSSIIERYTGDNGKKRIRTLEFYFYQPQGSDKLVLIR